MARVIVEQVFAEPLSDEAMSKFAKELDVCLEVRGGFWRRSSVSVDRMRMTCEFEAPDAGVVREAFGNAGVPYERVWSANVFAVEDYPEMLAKVRALEAKSSG